MTNYFKNYFELRALSKNKKQFNLLAFHLNENRHSDLIASILQCDSIYSDTNFIGLFLNSTGIKEFVNKNVHIYRELNKIDIVIYNDNQIVIIENKIHDANDQPNQLERYIESIRNIKLNENNYKFHPKDIYVLYLTKFGRRYSQNSLSTNYNGINIDNIKCISFENEIITWLDSCRNSIEKSHQRLYYSFDMYIEKIFNTLNNRNFLEINTYSRNIIIENIKKTLEDLEYDNENIDDHTTYDYSEDWFTFTFKNENCLELDICLTGSSIYFKCDSNGRSTNIPDLEIKTHDINDKYLVALLTNNEELIRDWITKSINFLTGES